MIVALSPLPSHARDTLSALALARRVRSIHLGGARREVRPFAPYRVYI